MATNTPSDSSFPDPQNRGGFPRHSHGDGTGPDDRHAQEHGDNAGYRRPYEQSPGNQQSYDQGNQQSYGQNPYDPGNQQAYEQGGQDDGAHYGAYGQPPQQEYSTQQGYSAQHQPAAGTAGQGDDKGSSSKTLIISVIALVGILIVGGFAVWQLRQSGSSHGASNDPASAAHEEIAEESEHVRAQVANVATMEDLLRVVTDYECESDRSSRENPLEEFESLSPEERQKLEELMKPLIDEMRDIAAQAAEISSDNVTLSEDGMSAQIESVGEGENSAEFSAEAHKVDDHWDVCLKE